MKILHIATGFSVSFPGGVTNYVRTLMKSQRTMGHQVDVLGGTGSAGQHKGDFADKVLDFEGVASVFSLSLDRDDKAKAAWLHELASSYDLVHFHMSYGFPASFYETRIPVPYVVSLHDYGYICPRVFMVDKWGGTCETRPLAKCQSCVGMLEQVNVLRAGSNRLGVKLPTIRSAGVKRRAARLDRFLKDATERLAVSSRVATIFEESVPGLNCTVLHIGNESAGAIPRRERWMASGKIRCCYIGTLNKDKGAEVFIELVKALPAERFEFAFWGRGEPKYVTALQELGVAINGAYTPDKLKGILSEVDIGLVLPVWNDNGPQVLMEFINNGVPVLGTSMGGVPDFLNNETGHLFDPAKGIQDAVAWMQTVDTAALQRMHNSIRPLKTPEQHAREMLAVYEAATDSVMAQ
jgi:glycosyltransferase involved in cell wall biosynthesis